MVRGSAVVRPSHVMGNPVDTPPGDVLVYRIWNILRESPTLYASRFNSSDKGNADPGNPLDSFAWEQAAASGEHSFICKGISFTIGQVVLHRLTKRGCWVPVTATPSGDCQLLPPTRGHWGLSAAVAFPVFALVLTTLCDLWQIRVELPVLLSGNGDSVLRAGGPFGATG